jgi:hypothetical protein
MRFMQWVIAGITLCLLAGCFQVATVVRVNPDGSGTVEERMLLSKKIIAQLNEMFQGFAGEGGEKPKPMEIFEPEKLKAQAATMGEGVTYRSGEKVETADYTGYTATYAFTDITKLKLSNAGSDAVGSAAGGEKPASLPMSFRFSKGSPATLTVVHPREKTAEDPAAKSKTAAPAAATPSQMPDEEAKKLAELFLGMRFQLALEVNGTIVSTNATHRDGQRLTLIDFDLAKLSDAAKNLEKLGMLNGASFDEAMVLLKDIPGMKADLNDELKVVFRK